MKKYLQEINLEFGKDENVMFDNVGFQTTRAGIFRFLRNRKVQKGRLVITNKRVIFKGIVSGNISGGGTSSGSTISGSISGGSDFSIGIKSIKNVYREKFSIPEQFGTLGLAPLAAAMMREGYIVIVNNNDVQFGFYVQNSNKAISTIKKLINSKSKTTYIEQAMYLEQFKDYLDLGRQQIEDYKELYKKNQEKANNPVAYTGKKIRNGAYGGILAGVTLAGGHSLLKYKLTEKRINNLKNDLKDCDSKECKDKINIKLDELKSKLDNIMKNLNRKAAGAAVLGAGVGGAAGYTKSLF